jgi:Putative amidase domain
MYNRRSILIIGMGCGLLLVALLFNFSPMRSGQAYAATNPAVSYANSHWNCYTVACTTRVGAGTLQPGFQCAEFVARALATEGLLPGLKSTSPQYAFDPYRPAGSNKSYDLLLIGHVGGLHTLADYVADHLVSRGLAKNIGKHLQGASPGDMVVIQDSTGAPDHTALIVATGVSTVSTKVDAHNYARYNYPLSAYFPYFRTYYIFHFSPKVA